MIKQHLCKFIFIFFIIEFTVFFSFFHPVTSLSPTPGTRVGHGMVFDEESNDIILFGGIHENFDTELLENMWFYNLETEEWRSESYNPSPSSRFNFAIIYLSGNNAFLLFGGKNVSNRAILGDTWIFNISLNEWKKIESVQSPDVGCDMKMQFVETADTVILFGNYKGGLPQTSPYFWQFNLSSLQWEPVISTNLPTIRYGHSISYNSNNNKLYIFGGESVEITNDLWEYDILSKNWTKIIKDDCPTPRYLHVSNYIADSNILIVFGGNTDTPQEHLLGDTWMFNFSSNEWRNLSLIESPSARCCSSMVYSPISHDLFLYGGLDANYQSGLDDLWQFDSSDLKWIIIPSENKTIAGYPISLIIIIPFLVIIYFLIKKLMRRNL